MDFNERKRKVFYSLIFLVRSGNETTMQVLSCKRNIRILSLYLTILTRQHHYRARFIMFFSTKIMKMPL